MTYRDGISATEGYFQVSCQGRLVVTNKIILIQNHHCNNNYNNNNNYNYNTITITIKNCNDPRKQIKQMKCKAN